MIQNSFIKRSTALSAIPNGSNKHNVSFNEIIDFIGQDNQITIGSNMFKFLVFSTQIGHRLQMINRFYDFTYPPLCDLHTCQFAIKLINVVKFVGSPS